LFLSSKSACIRTGMFEHSMGVRNRVGIGLSK
jgi:hypothetical protein